MIRNIDKKRFRLYRAGVMLGLVLWICNATSPAQAADPSACSCVDLADLKSRRAQAVAASQAYANYLQKMDQDPARYSQVDYSHVQLTEIKPALDAYCGANYCPSLPSLPGARGPANTSWSCTMNIIDNTTPCLKEILRAHEEQHVKTCELKRPTFMESLTTGEAWQNRLGLRGSLDDEVAAYLAEIGFIDQVLARIGNCSAPSPAPSARSIFDSLKSIIPLRGYLRGNP